MSIRRAITSFFFPICLSWCLPTPSPPYFLLQWRVFVYFCLFFSQLSIRKLFQFRFASKGSIVKLQSYQRYMNVKWFMFLNATALLNQQLFCKISVRVGCFKSPFAPLVLVSQSLRDNQEIWLSALNPAGSWTKQTTATLDLALPKYHINIHLTAAIASPLPLDQIIAR